MSKAHDSIYKKGDEVSFATPSGMLYGTVLRVLDSGPSSAVEIEFEDGRVEIKKSRDRALSLLRRASGVSAIEENQTGRTRLRDPDIERVRKSEQKRRWK